MGYDQPENRSSSGAIVAVLVAVLLVVVVGGVLAVGVGAYFWMRTARVATERALVAEHEAPLCRPKASESSRAGDAAAG